MEELELMLDTLTAIVGDMNKWCIATSEWLQIAYKIAIPLSITVVCWLIFLTVIVLRKGRK